MEKRNLLTTFTVINPNDGEAGSLRDAIEQANASVGADTIQFALAVDAITVSEQILITDDLTIRGPGAEKLTINGDGDRVFAVVPAKYAEETDLFTTPTPEQLEDAPESGSKSCRSRRGWQATPLVWRIPRLLSEVGFTTSAVSCI